MTGQARRVLVLGGDGYCGWPTALHLSARGWAVGIVDNLVRREWDRELGTSSLAPIRTLEKRIEAWTEVSGKRIARYHGDVADATFVDAIVRDTEPDTVVHLAQQRSAPFSMIDRDHAVLTQVANITGTLNLLFALKEHVPTCHLVKLGTMGVYGTPNIDIEEGFIGIEHGGRHDTLPFPKQPGSFYHLSKAHDGANIMFCCRAWGIRATDLNQGVVYGSHTYETALDRRLVNRFDYDAIFGTVINRFCVQAAIDEPITVYGRGGQTRGFIDLRDTVRCIELACRYPAAPGEYRVYNQFTEQFSVRELATRVAAVARTLGCKSRVTSIADPRVEADDHYYRARNRGLHELGLEPHLLSDETLCNLLTTVRAHAERVDRTTLQPRVDWRAARNPSRPDGSGERRAPLMTAGS